MGILFFGGGEGLLRRTSGVGLLRRLGGGLGLLRRLSGVRLRRRLIGLGDRLLGGEARLRKDGEDGLRRLSNIGLLFLLYCGLGERRRIGLLGGDRERDLRRLGGLPGELLRL